jgi:uncharacterized protein YjbI with pentapeptide repeats
MNAIRLARVPVACSVAVLVLCIAGDLLAGTVRSKKLPRPAHRRDPQRARRQDATGPADAKADLRGSKSAWGEPLSERAGPNTHYRYPRRRVVTQSELDSQDLRGADLSGTEMRALDLRLRNLRGANLRGADLSESSFLMSQLDGADLAGAFLWRAKLCRASLRDSKLQRAQLDGADLSQADFTEANLFMARGAQITLEGALLRRSKMDSCHLSGNFEDADLRGADLSGADLYSAGVPSRMQRAVFDDCTGPGFTARQADLRGASFRHSRIPWAALDGADLTGADLTAAVLTNAALSFCYSARLRGDVNTILKDAKLVDADLTNANLERADLRGADLSGAQLVGCHLENALMEGARFDAVTKFPAGFEPSRRGLVRSGGRSH